MVEPYSLPQELTDKTVDALFDPNDRRSIFACSQVSRAFRSRCLHYMFRDVVLSGPRHPKTLYDLCLNSPRLCSCIANLTFVTSDPNSCWDMNTDKSLLLLVKLLKKVTIIYISGLRWGWFPDDVLDAIASLPLLAGLSLHDISFSDGVQSFYSFVGQLGNLVVVRIQGKMTISESEEALPVVLHETIQTKPVTVQNLHIYSSPLSQLFVNDMFTSPASPFTLRNLQTLTLDVDPTSAITATLMPGSGDHDFLLLKRIIDESRETLFKLHLITINFIPPPFDISLCHLSNLTFTICELPILGSVPIRAIKWLTRALTLPNHMESARLGLVVMVLVGEELLWMLSPEGSECLKYLDSVLIDSRYPLQKFAVGFGRLNEDQKDARKLKLIQSMPQLHKKGLLEIV
ncbi:hypothetical protein EDD18DRAFT_1151514 [Armillaria luteobubalina]|uniref:F-box domain-containing protein n=1 Tax=Armillaria luteobubalina TaxID=153913 RepID=A0AA39QDJ0_9AGAR|nr:hypothetical protein EDD18DRAFT_1151514 [Armillaria luteobubalina]